MILYEFSDAFEWILRNHEFLSDGEKAKSKLGKIVSEQAQDPGESSGPPMGRVI